MGDEEPGDLGGCRAFKVFSETTASAEPGKGAFDDPTPRQELEALDAEWPLDDLDRPRSAAGERINELWAAIDAIGKDASQLGKVLPQALEQGDCAMHVLNVGGMNMDCQEQTVGVGDDVPLASIDTFAWIIATRPAGVR